MNIILKSQYQLQIMSFLRSHQKFHIVRWGWHILMLINWNYLPPLYLLSKYSNRTASDILTIKNFGLLWRLVRSTILYMHKIFVKAFKGLGTVDAFTYLSSGWDMVQWRMYQICDSHTMYYILHTYILLGI